MNHLDPITAKHLSLMRFDTTAAPNGQTNICRCFSLNWSVPQHFLPENFGQGKIDTNLERKDMSANWPKVTKKNKRFGVYQPRFF